MWRRKRGKWEFTKIVESIESPRFNWNKFVGIKTQKWWKGVKEEMNGGESEKKGGRDWRFVRLEKTSFPKTESPLSLKLLRMKNEEKQWQSSKRRNKTKKRNKSQTVKSKQTPSLISSEEKNNSILKFLQEWWKHHCYNSHNMRQTDQPCSMNKDLK